MPDIETKKPRRQLKNIPPDRFQPKVLLFWVALAFAVVALLFWSPGITVSPAQLKINEVVSRAEANESFAPSGPGALTRPSPNAR